MRILMVASYAGTVPYLDEMCMHLHQRGIETEMLDIFKLEHRKFVGGQKFEKGQSICNSKISNAIGQIPGRVSKYIVRPFVASWLKRNATLYDLGIVQFVSPEFAPCINDIRRSARKLVSVVWGSDFYRTSSETRSIQKPIYDVSDAIIFGNPSTAADFGAYFSESKSKINIANFGIQKLELLKPIVAKEDKNDSKRRLGLPTDKIIVTCGYNAGEAQQHELIIDAIAGLADDIKRKIHIALPMTYGAPQKRAEDIKCYLQGKGIAGTVYSEFMSNEDVAHLRWATDIVINAQTSDSLSASLQEHLYAKNILLVGDWLPYAVFKDRGISFLPFSKENLRCEIEKAFGDWDHLKKAADLNTEKVYDLSNWDIALKRWMKVFDKLSV